MDEYTIVKNHVPQSIQDLITSGNSHKVAELITGLSDFSLYKVAEFIGQDMANYRRKWRPVVDGLIALDNLNKR